MKYLYITAIFFLLVSCSNEAIDSDLNDTSFYPNEIEVIEDVSITQYEDTSTQDAIEQEMLGLVSEPEVQNQESMSETVVQEEVEPEIEVIETPAVSEPSNKKAHRSGSSGY